MGDDGPRFHHQPEARHSNFFGYHKIAGRLPHLSSNADVTQANRDVRIWPEAGGWRTYCYLLMKLINCESHV
jgi:hypothetical protein